VDSCKGICIVLVVYGHVVGGLVAGGIVLTGSLFEQGRNWVYLFHMPTFFFLSGLFATRLSKRPFNGVLTSRLKTLVYPYLLWTGTYLLVQVLLARYANNPPDTSRALRFLWEPYGYGLWFLYALFVISLLFHLIQMAHLPKPVVLFLAAGLYTAAAFNVFSGWPIFNTAMLNFIFYALGGLFSASTLTWFSNKGKFFPLLIGIGLWGMMTALALHGTPLKFPLGLVAALAGIAGVVFISQGLTGGIGKFFCLLGFYSLEIYLCHPLFSIGARVMAGKLHFHAAWIYVVLELGCGVFISLALATACRRFAFPYLFRWPMSRQTDAPKVEQN
jgi:fucose 4-O-acetylase-like acetyltransferase